MYEQEPSTQIMPWRPRSDPTRQAHEVIMGRVIERHAQTIKQQLDPIDRFLTAPAVDRGHVDHLTMLDMLFHWKSVEANLGNTPMVLKYQSGWERVLERNLFDDEEGRSLYQDLFDAYYRLMLRLGDTPDYGPVVPGSFMIQPYREEVLEVDPITRIRMGAIIHGIVRNLVVMRIETAVALEINGADAAEIARAAKEAKRNLLSRWFGRKTPPIRPFGARADDPLIACLVRDIRQAWKVDLHSGYRTQREFSPLGESYVQAHSLRLGFALADRSTVAYRFSPLCESFHAGFYSCGLDRRGNIILTLAT